MALTTLANGGVIRFPDHALLALVSSYALDAAGEKYAAIFLAPKTGNIHKIGIYVISVSDQQTIKGSVQGVDSAGKPDGTILASGSAYGTFTPAATTRNNATMTSDPAVTKGDQLSVVFEFDSTTGSVNLARGTNAQGLIQGSTYDSYYNGSAWFNSATTYPCVYIEYDDGTSAYIGNAFPLAGASPFTNTYNSASTPNEYGNKIVAPFGGRVCGIGARVDIDYAATICLYDATPTLLDSVSVGPSMRPGTSAYNFEFHFADGGVEVTGDDVLYATMLATSSNISSYGATYGTDGIGQMPMGLNCVQCTRSGGSGAFSDTGSSTGTRNFFWLIYDAIDIPAGGGGSGRFGAGMRGGVIQR